MGAFTGSPSGSVQFNLQTGVTQGGISYGEKAKIRRFSYVHSAGAGTGEINLVQLPVGFLTIYPDLSRIVTSQFAATATFDLGFRAYTEPDGDVIAEDDNAFADDVAVGAGAIDQAWTLPAIGFLEANVGAPSAAQHEGFVIFMSVDTANIEDGDTIDGYVVWADPS